MPSRRDLTIAGVRAALAFRHAAGIQPDHPVSIFDLTLEKGIEVRFAPLPSLEGMYVNQSPPLIILSALRPSGRQAMSCAHELGHHHFGHGTQVDRYIKEGPAAPSQKQEEHLANIFAAFLLMPKAAVLRGFIARGFALDDPSPQDVYQVASWLGVGYTALIYQMTASLSLLSAQRAKQLLASAPAAVRRMIRGHDGSNGLVVADRAWIGRPIDVQVGDDIMVPDSSHFDGPCTLVANGLLRASTPGIGRLEHEGWSTFVRVSRVEYVGLAQYRHLEGDIDAV